MTEFITLTVEIGPDEIGILRRIDSYLAKHRRSPKQHEVIAPGRTRLMTHAEREEVKLFKRLVQIGAIIHARNGHCWLSPAIEQALAQAPGNQGSST